jgi:hypothetical protein
MKRNIYAVLVLILALGGLSTPALAAGIDPVAVSLHPNFPWLNLPADTVKYLPPGSATDTSKVVVGQPYAGFWLFGVIDSLGATPTIQASVDYRARVRFPGQTSVYWTPWTVIDPFLLMSTPDSLYFAPVWAADTLGWFDDLQFRVYDTTGTNDSSKIRLWLVKRYRR